MPAPSRRRRLRLAVGVVVVVGVGTIGGVAYARTGGTAGYRTAAVTRGTVTASLDLVGTITPVQSATVGFAQSGTVAAVDVTVGQAVTAGQTLAQLDLTSLQAKLAQAQATEAAARQTVTQAENGQLPAGSGGTGSGGTASGGASTSRSGGSVDTAATTSAQQGVVTAQKAVDRAQTTARAALAAAGTTCGSGSTTQGSSSRGSTPQGSTPQGSTAQGSATAQGGTSDCLAAEQTALGAESDLAAKQTALASAQTTLAQTLSKDSAAAASNGAGATPPATAVTAVQLAQYQAALDADTAAVGVAQQALDQGTAVSPLAGTVVSVALTPGQSVSAASSTAVIAVSSPGGYEVDTVVPTSDIATVAVGQQASVTPDGGTGTLTATVTSIRATASTSGFPVVLGLSAAGAPLHQGASASVSLTTGRATDSTVVPTSAVHTIGTRHVVEVLNGSTPQPTVVTIGVVGATQTQVLSGLTAGQRVVLADLSSTVTSDSSTTTGARTGIGGAAGLGGGGFAGRAAAGGAGTGRAAGRGTG